MENRNGLIVQADLTAAHGHAERKAALGMIHRHSPDSTKRLSLGADKRYDSADFVADLRVGFEIMFAMSCPCEKPCLCAGGGFSQSLAMRRHRPSHARAHSIPQRRGMTSKPCAVSERLTICNVQRPLQLGPGRPAFLAQASAARSTSTPHRSHRLRICHRIAHIGRVNSVQAIVISVQPCSRTETQPAEFTPRVSDRPLRGGLVPHPNNRARRRRTSCQRPFPSPRAPANPPP